MEPRLNRQ